jgi:predicted regulator of Ras-like GTPase activity (Roadblock/LC7/MglB family)
MSFGEVLRTIVEECGGGISAALMGNDGIPIEEYLAKGLEDSAGAGGPAEPTTAGVEFGRILIDIRKASDALGGGSMDETIVQLGRFTLIFRPVDDENFLVLLLRPDGNLGKARYLIRRHMLAIRQEF